MRRATIIGLGVALCACTTFPEIDAAQTPGIDSAPYPDLVPIETLLASDPPRATPEIRDGIEARAAALRGRAQALRGPIVDGSTRARMEAGIAPPGEG